MSRLSGSRSSKRGAFRTRLPQSGTVGARKARVIREPACYLSRSRAGRAGVIHRASMETAPRSRNWASLLTCLDSLTNPPVLQEVQSQGEFQVAVATMRLEEERISRLLQRLLNRDVCLRDIIFSYGDVLLHLVEQRRQQGLGASQSSPISAPSAPARQRTSAPTGLCRGPRLERGRRNTE
jgi:hypothetical protein